MMSPDDVSDEQLAAYLAGDVDDLAARRIEARLADDIELGQRLDRVADTLVALRDPDAIEPPAGLRERLQERIEAAVPAAPSSPAPSRAAPRVQQWYRTVGAVAAGVVALVVVGSGLVSLGVGGFSAGEDAAETAGDMDTMDAPERSMSDDAAESGESDESAPGAADEGAVEEEAAEAPLDDEALDQDEAFEEDAGSDGTMEPPIATDDAARVADRRWSELPEEMAACRDEVEEVMTGPSVPLEAHEERLEGRGVVVYQLATVLDEGARLDDRAEVIVDRGTCEVVRSEIRP